MLYDNEGRRKYLTSSERKAFINAARQMPPPIAIFCATLTITGVRISELLALTPARIDLQAGVFVFECLKKRRKGIFRAVPAPQQLLLAAKALANADDQPENQHIRIWSWSRTTAWKHVKTAMLSAGISAELATPKSARHGFGVGAAHAKIPPNLLQKWMGHSRLSTTSIYVEVMGDEELDMASWMWRDLI